MAVSGCSAEEDNSELQQEEQEDGEQEGQEGGEEGDSRNATDLDSFVPTPPGYPNTTFFNEIYQDGYSLEESSISGDDFVQSDPDRGLGDPFSEINHQLGIGYIINQGNGVLEVFPSVSAAEKRLELLEEAFPGSSLEIEGWDSWHLVEETSEWDQVLNWEDNDRKYPLLLEVADESKQHVIIQINNIILTVGVVNDEFSDPRSVLVDSIESRSNEFGSAGVPEDLLELGHIYSTTDIDYSEPDPDEVASRDYFAVPLEEFSEDNVSEIWANRIATHDSVSPFEIDTETGNYGERDISTSFSTFAYRVEDPQLPFVGDSIDRFPGPWNPTLTEERSYNLGIIYNVYDTIETAVSEYRDWINYAIQDVNHDDDQERTAMTVTTGSGYDEQGFYVEEFVGTLRYSDGQMRLNGSRYLLRRTYLSGNATVQISHQINNFNYI